MDLIGSIPDHNKISHCKAFVKVLQDLEDQLKAIKSEVEVLKPPEVPDLESVHGAIDHCQVYYSIIGT